MGRCYIVVNTVDNNVYWVEGTDVKRTLGISLVSLMAGALVVPALVSQERVASASGIARLVMNTGSTATLGAAAGSTGEIRSLTVQPDGKVIVGGNFTSWKGGAVNGLVRLNADLSLDSTFTNNVASAPSHTSAFYPVRSVTLAGNGDIWISGEFTQWSSNPAKGLVRLNEDGTFDTGFTTWPSSATTSGKFNAVALQSDGSMIVAIPQGASWHPSGSSNCKADSQCSLGRINSDGTRDTQFTSNGGVPNGTVEAIRVQDDNKILVGGSFSSLSGTAGGASNIGKQLVRFNADGTRDTAFNANVAAVMDTGPVYSIGIQSDSKILVAGNLRVTHNTVTYSVKIIRFNSDGTIDTGFLANIGGSNGGFKCIVISCGMLDQSPRKIEVLSNDEILVGGFFNGFGGASASNLVGPGVVLLKADGSLKASLGRATNDGNNTSWARSGAHEVNTAKYVLSVTRLSDGTLLAAGDFKHWANSGCESGSPLTSSTESCEVNVGRIVALNVMTAPTVSGVSPSSGPAIGGTALTINGTDFLAGASVTVGGAPCTSVVVLSSTRISCVSPNGVAGAVNVAVTNASGYETTSSQAFAYVAAPTVLGVSPSSGSVSGGTSLTITGTNFSTGATVTVGGAPCSGVTVVSTTSLTCTTSARTEVNGAVIRVTNTDTQFGELVNGYSYTTTTTTTTVVPAAPAATTVTPVATVAPTTSTTPVASNAATPSLVTSANQAALTASPGKASVLVNGVAVTPQIVTASNSASAQADPAERTPEQVRELQQAAATIETRLDTIAGGDSGVSVVRTETGAVMTGIFSGTRVPVEDVVVVNAADTATLFAARDVRGNIVEVKPGAVLEVASNGDVAVQAFGLRPGETVELVVMSTPTLLGKFTVDAKGAIKTSAKLPTSIGSGNHSLVVASPSVKASLGLKLVKSAASLPVTGSNTTDTTNWAVAVLLSGLYLMLVSRSRRRVL
jgi:uncharacterized delta-60 repeat protein